MEKIQSLENLRIEWTGDYPCLCYGRWVIYLRERKLLFPGYKEGHKLTENSHANTFGSYSKWSFGDSLLEDWNRYDDGLEFREWVNYQYDWIMDFFKLNDIAMTEENLEYLYEEFSRNDWRRGSCGGCI